MPRTKDEPLAHILVADDSRSARSMICKILRNEGYRVTEAENGKEAVKRFREEIPDLVLMDANMPVVDGFKACTEIKHHPKGVHTRLIMVTGQGDDASVDKAFSAGAEEYVTKPIHWAVMLRRIQLAIENFRAQKEIREARTRLEVILNTAADTIIVINHQGIIESVNHAATKVFGYTIHEMMHRNVSMLMPSPYAEQHDGYLANHMASGQAKILGKNMELIASHKNGHTFPIEMVISAVKLEDRTLFTGIVRDITERKLAEEKIFYQANYDALTTLPNRAMFMRTLKTTYQKAEQNNQAFALIFVDLDRFKWVNDTLGHAAGDTLLKASAERIQATLGGKDMVARLGGDEFIVILQDDSKLKQVETTTRTILDALNEPFTLAGQAVNISGSLGVALYPQDANNADDLLKNSDEAMYLSKKAGRNAYHFFKGPSLILEKKYA